MDELNGEVHEQTREASATPLPDKAFEANLNAVEARYVDTGQRRISSHLSCQQNLLMWYAS